MRKKTGTVISDKNDKTITVIVHFYKMHPKYKKRYRSSKKYLTHDPNNEYKIGDNVTIHEANPISKNKRWTVEIPKAEQKLNPTKKLEEQKTTSG